MLRGLPTEIVAPDHDRTAGSLPNVQVATFVAAVVEPSVSESLFEQPRFVLADEIQLGATRKHPIEQLEMSGDLSGSRRAHRQAVRKSQPQVAT